MPDKKFIHNENPDIDLQIKEILRKKFVDVFGFDVLPVFNVNDNVFMAGRIARDVTLSDGTNVTIFTTPDDPTKTFFLSSIHIAMVSDLNAVSVRSSVTASVGGVTRVLLDMRYQIAANSKEVNIVFDKPIPIDRNTAIALTNSNGTASIDTTGAITGFLSTRTPFQ